MNDDDYDNENDLETDDSLERLDGWAHRNPRHEAEVATQIQAITKRSSAVTEEDKDESTHYL